MVLFVAVLAAEVTMMIMLTIVRDGILAIVYAVASSDGISDDPCSSVLSRS